MNKRIWMYRVRRWTETKCKNIKTFSCSYILFAVSLLLSSLVLLTSIFPQFKLYIDKNNEVSIIYNLNVYGSIDATDATEYYIYVGGYCTEVNLEGQYELDFLSGNQNGVLMIIMNKNNVVVDYIILDYGQENTKKCDIQIG
ncbi:MAG: hypothetical protein R3Y24_11490 [Eubacteriales bacterium]